jgi:hypothetical protein
MYGLEGVSGPDALMNPFYVQLVDALQLERIWGWRIHTSAANFAAAKPALDFLNVRHYVDLHGAPGQLEGLVTPVADADLSVYRSESCWPRAFFAAGVITYDNLHDLAAKIRSTNGRPFAALQREDLARLAPQLPPTLPVTADPHTNPARDYRLTTNTTEFTVEASGPGLAVLQEAWLAGSFRATLDGAPVPVLRVNHAFKAVAIPSAGLHRVAFTYRPPRFFLSLGLSAAGLILLLGTGAFVWRVAAPSRPATA